MNNNILGITKVNEVFLHLSCSDFFEIRKIHEHFKEFVPNYRHMPRFKQRVWDGKLSPVDVRTQNIPIGLWKELLEYCQKAGLKFVFKNIDPKELFQDDRFDKTFVESYIKTVVEQTMPFHLRDDQIHSVFTAMQFKKCILLLATGFGKSAVIFALMRLLYSTREADKVLIVVPSINLVNQMRSNFVDDYGWLEFDDYGYLLCNETSTKDKKLIDSNDIDKPFIITTWQSIQRKSEKWFEQFDAIIVDEVHGVSSSSKSLQGITKKSINAKYRIGLTGTLGDEAIDRQTTIGSIGPVAYVVKAKELMDKQILSKLKIKSTIIRYSEETSLLGLDKDYHSEVQLIESLPERYNVFDKIFSEIEDGQNTLILGKHVQHINDIADYIKNKYNDKYIVDVITGEISGKKREDIRVRMNESKNYILVASYATVGTGLNIPSIENIIFAASSKSLIKVIQSIGRSLRLKEGKSHATVYDLVDDFSEIQGTGRRVNRNHCYKHYEFRKSVYDREQYFYEEELVQL